MRRWSVGVGAVSVVWAAACGGIWQEVFSDSFSELTVLLETSVPEDDAHYADALTLLEDGWVAAWEGNAGFGQVVMFQVSFEDAVADGTVTDGEMALLNEKASEFIGEPVTAERRAALMPIKAEMDAKLRGVASVAPPAPSASSGALAGWELPGDVRAAVQGAGWAVVTCSDTMDHGEHWVGCVATRGEDAAMVDVMRYDNPRDAETYPMDHAASRKDGATVLEVVVHDGASAERLMDVSVPPGTHLGDLDPGTVRKAIEKAGYEIEHCDDAMEGRERYVECEAAQGDRLAVVTMVLQKGGRGRQQRQVEEGIAMVFQGESSVSVVVMAGGPANELAKALAP